jgi:HEAT repeat protein
MGVLDAFKVHKSIAALLHSGEVSGSERVKAFSTLKQLRARAVPTLIELLGSPDSSDAAREILKNLLDNSTLPLLCEGLAHGNARVVHGVVQVLSAPGRFDPNLLLDHFGDPDIPTAHLVEILLHQKGRLDAGAVLRLLDRLDRDSLTPIFRLLDDVATEAILPDLIERTRSDDWLVRFNATRILRRFATDAVRDTLLTLLQDPNKSVRVTALEGLASLRMPLDVAPVVRMLRDPDLTVQSKAIDTIARINDPRAVQHLLDVLQDESEYVRRAGVEVLNLIGNADTIKELLQAMRDRDWWVRVRAADALGTIGGPKVVEAMLALLTDQDEFIRRSAIEVLNLTKDERAINHLVDALGDADWWVRERAADALASLGDGRAVPALIRLMEGDAESAPAAIRALASLKNPAAIRPLLGQLRSGKKAARVEALRALDALTGEDDAESVQRALLGSLQDQSEEFVALANQALGTIIGRFGDKTRVVERPEREHESTIVGVRSLLQGDSGPRLAARPAEQAAEAAASAPPPVPIAAPTMDPSTFRAGMVVGDRYRVVSQVGSGGFGVVVLLQDIVVGEEVILKFLKPHVAADEKAIKRFIHEIRYARRITHENVIRIYDFLTFGGGYAISMEYFPSHSLAAELQTGRLMNKARALKILQDVCRGMSVAHQADVVHRDLKPANILINDSDVVKIVDFGLAAAASHGDSRLTTTGFLVGTPTYMAPEQVRGGPFDPRTDIYSLGVIMYEIFTGKPPYSADDPMSILFQHVEGKATRPGEIRTDISPSLESTILKAMAVDPAWRHQSMEELRQELEALLREEML